MSKSFVQYVADGSNNIFDITFDYLRPEHIKVLINGNPPVLPFVLDGLGRVVIEDTLVPGQLVEIRRTTPFDQSLVDFQNGSVLTEEDLDTAIRQLLFIQQELSDRYDASLSGALATVANDGGVVVPPGLETLDALAQELILNEAAQDLAQGLSDIIANANSIVDLSNEQTLIRADHTALVAVVDGLTGGDPGAGVVTALATETQNRIDGDSAIVQTIDLLGAKSGDGTAFILDASTVLLSPTETLTSKLNVLTTQAADNAAAISSEASTRASEVAAQAAQITSLQTSVDGNNATVATLASSVSGLEGRYGVTIDVNGYVTGFVQNNDGTTGSFDILADRFSIVSPNGGSPVNPFTVTGETVSVNGDLIVNGSITTAGLADNAVTKGASAFFAGSVISTGSATAVAQVDLETTGGDVRVDFCGAFSYFGGGPATSVQYRVRRGATIIREGTLVQTFGQQLVNVQDSETSATIGTATIPTPTTGTYAIFVVDTTAPPGTHTYYVDMIAPSGGVMESRQVAALEFKR